ncbi:hypothetical protein ACFXPJ_11710, partial [Streptomyces goshikiensis]
MRVLHAVTLHSPSHAFGGPVRVALNLAKGLRERGHEARLLALVDPALGRPVEGKAHLLEVEDRVDGLLRQDLGGVLVDQVVT